MTEDNFEDEVLQGLDLVLREILDLGHQGLPFLLFRGLRIHLWIGGGPGHEGNVALHVFRERVDRRVVEEQGGRQRRA